MAGNYNRCEKCRKFCKWSDLKCTGNHPTYEGNELPEYMGDVEEYECSKCRGECE